MSRFVRTWWGEKFLDVLEDNMDIGRLKRGRSYAGPNRLLKFDINNHNVNAVVRGNINPYFGVYKEPHYKVSVRLKTFPSKTWNEISKSMSQNAAVISQLLMGQMPDNIESVFQQSNCYLLPRERQDLIEKCSCPDWASPCKHVAGVYYKIASLLDRDPLLLFQLRGMKFEALHTRLVESRLGKALIDQMEDQDPEIEIHDQLFTEPSKQPVEIADLKSFWQGDGPLPDVNTADHGDSTAAVLVKRGGEFPGFWDRHNSFTEAMESVYRRISDKNKAAL